MDSLERLWRTFFDLEILGEVLPKLAVQGLPNTLLLSVLGCIIGTGGGIVLAACRYAGPLVRVPAVVFTNVMRALPAILIVYLIGQGFPLSGLDVFGSNTYAYAALGIGLMEAAYIGEIFRSGMQSVETNLVESARSLGLSRRRALWLVIIPIGVRRILPALTNQFIIIVKATSLVYLLGLSIHQRELFSIAKDEVTARGSFTPLVAAGILYLMITLPLTMIVDRYDDKLRGGINA